ncbi:MAG: CHAT domain-containing protein [Chloroflexales bacterium]|nr:CHAT domain-containing protein [Chloroflexales bacterium]
MDAELREALLIQAALLDWFDADIMRSLAEAASPALSALIDAGIVVAAPGRPSALMLRDDVREAALQRLHAMGAYREIELRSRTFYFFLERMATAQDQRRDDDEHHCFTQLARLFSVFYIRLEWQAIRDLLDAVATAQPRLRHHVQRLTLYQAFVALRTGDYAAGELLLEQLFALGALEPQVHLDATLARGNMLRYLTQYDRALQVYEELIELARNYGQEVYCGVAYFNMGSIYNEIEQYEHALDLVLESERIFLAHSDQERLALACYSAGLNAMYLGRWSTARDKYAEATRRFTQLAMEPPLAACYWGQGFLNLILGNPVASEKAYRQALDYAYVQRRGDPVAAMDSWWQLGFLYYTLQRHAEALQCYDEAEQLAEQLQHKHRASNIHYVRGRTLQALGRADEANAAYGRALDAVDSLRGAHKAEEIKIGVLGTAQQVYEAAALHRLALGQAAEAFAVVERACSRAFLDSLAAKDPELSEAFALPTVGLDEVQATLPEGAVLLEYYTTGVLPSGEHFFHKIPPENKALLKHLLLPAGVVLFAITRDSCAAHHIALDPNSLRPTAGDPRPGRHLVRERVLTSLYTRLIGPVEGLLAGCAQLFIVPHGPLHYVPFMALRSPGGRHLLAAEGPAIAIAPSATILLRNCLRREPAPADGAFLALGYNSEGEGALRYAEHEARIVARAIGGAALTGAEARTTALTAAAPGLRALHIAGHARFRPDDPLGSYLALAGGDTLSARTIMGSINLRADLVVLSACTSGLSHVVPGDELLGLQRAWLHAGASAVVCALWEATDLVTLLLMERFYAALAGGATPGIALRDAIVAVRGLTGRELARTFTRWREESDELAAPGALPEVPADLDETALYADPIHWAPFMLIGRP